MPEPGLDRPTGEYEVDVPAEPTAPQPTTAEPHEPKRSERTEREK